jgi:hypothetical protein
VFEVMSGWRAVRGEFSVPCIRLDYARRSLCHSASPWSKLRESGCSLAHDDDMTSSTTSALARVLVCTTALLALLILFFHDNVTTTITNLHVNRYITGASTAKSAAGATSSVYLRDYVLEDLGPRGDAAWASLTTKHGGFLWVQYNETLDIQYGISMFHGLHCLQMLRTEFKAKLGLDSNSEVTHDHHGRARKRSNVAAVQGDTTLETHLGHCLAYVAMVRSTPRGKSKATNTTDRNDSCFSVQVIARSSIRVCTSTSIPEIWSTRALTARTHSTNAVVQSISGWPPRRARQNLFRCGIMPSVIR